MQCQTPSAFGPAHPGKRLNFLKELLEANGIYAMVPGDYYVGRLDALLLVYDDPDSFFGVPMGQDTSADDLTSPQHHLWNGRNSRR